MRKALILRQPEEAHPPRTPGIGSDADARELPAASVLILEETIERGIRSYLLIRYAADGAFAGDTWHATIDEALEQASYEFGDALGAWVDVPPDVEDAWTFIARLRPWDVSPT